MNYQNILIVKLSAIGDVIHALPVARALKKCFPDCRITWVVENPAYDLLTNNPDIDEIIVFDKPKFKSLSGLIKHVPEMARLLKSRQFDLAIDLQGLFKSAMLAWLSGAPVRIGYCNMRELSGLVSKPVCGINHKGHVVERYLDVARALQCNVETAEFVVQPSIDDIKTAQELLAINGINPGARYAVFAPGTNWASKCWPAGNYAKLIDLIWQTYQLPAVIIGGSKDGVLMKEIKRLTSYKPIDLIGKTTLKQLAVIHQESSFFVGGDTGPMHLAVAMGTPVIALFGPSDYKRNGPYGYNQKVICSELECGPCFKRDCKTMECMEMIAPETVFEAVSDLLPPGK